MTVEEKDDIEFQEFMDKTFNLIEAAHEICKEKGKQYEFKCPNCGNTAIAGRASCNGHLRVYCDGCGVSMIQ